MISVRRRIARLQGLLEYHLRPRLALGFGTLNGQVIRRRIVERLIRDLEIVRIVEAGSFRGTTTEYFGSFGLPVLGIEINPRFHAFSRRRLRHLGHVEVHLGDAPRVLAALADEGVFGVGRTFFYLDDHWLDELPLLDDLRVIFGRVPGHVVLVDDFRVPGDDGYGFDRYAGGRELCLDYLLGGDLPARPQVFFPRAPSAAESGRRRGSVVLTTEAAAASILGAMDELKPHVESETSRSPPCVESPD